MNILVRNMARSVTEEKLLAKFRPFGTVTSASIVTDQETGQSKGFGFVEMPDQAESEAAIKALNHTKFFNEKIRVKEANPKFGPDYFSEHNQPQTATERPAPARTAHPSSMRTGKPGFNPNFTSGSRNGSTGSPYRAESRYSSNDTGLFLPKKDLTVGNAAPSLSSLKNSRPRSPRFSRPDAKVGFKGGFRKRHGADKRDHAHSPFSSREAGRPEYKPRGERPSGQHGSGERSSHPYSRFTKRDDNRPAASPRGERSFGSRSSGERKDQPRSQFPSRDSSRPEHKPRGERPSGPHGSGERSSHPYSRFMKRDGNRPGPAPRGERPRSK